MAIKFEDFKPVTKHEGYFIRDLGDNGTGSGKWVELNRKDGFCFGSMPIEAVEGIIESDKTKPAPATGGSLRAIFGVAEEEDDEPAPAPRPKRFN